MDSFPDLRALTEQELNALVEELAEAELKISDDLRVLHAQTEAAQTDEAAISYRRRHVHGKLDIVRAELVNRRRPDRGGGDGGGDGPPGVREPRRPKPGAGGGGVSLPAPDTGTS